MKALRTHISLRNTHFRRQVVLGDFIVDFCCLSARLILEVDGNQHLVTEADYDQRHTTYLKGQGFSVLRFSNADVMREIGGVLARIEVSLTGKIAGVLPTPTPAPPRKGEGRVAALY